MLHSAKGEIRLPRNWLTTNGNSTLACVHHATSYQLLIGMRPSVVTAISPRGICRYGEHPKAPSGTASASLGLSVAERLRK